MTRKSPKAADVYVGQRIKLRRMTINMSQEALADKTDISFQQIQKYEKGTNRISASRLVEISSLLGVPVEWFFEGLPGYDPNQTPMTAPILSFVSTHEGIRIANAFEAIHDPRRQMSIVQLIEAIADSDSEDGSNGRSGERGTHERFTRAARRPK